MMKCLKCEKDEFAKGYCNEHYQHFNYGNELIGAIAIKFNEKIFVSSTTKGLNKLIGDIKSELKNDIGHRELTKCFNEYIKDNSLSEFENKKYRENLVEEKVEFIIDKEFIVKPFIVVDGEGNIIKDDKEILKEFRVNCKTNLNSKADERIEEYVEKLKRLCMKKYGIKN